MHWMATRVGSVPTAPARALRKDSSESLPSRHQSRAHSTYRFVPSSSTIPLANRGSSTLISLAVQTSVSPGQGVTSQRKVATCKGAAWANPLGALPHPFLGVVGLPAKVVRRIDDLGTQAARRSTATRWQIDCSIRRLPSDRQPLARLAPARRR